MQHLLLSLLAVLTCHLPVGSSPQLSMADAGDLEQLPPEIRDEIYALALVQTEPLTLCNYGNDQKRLGERSGRGRRAPKMKNQWARTKKPKVAPVDHKRNLKGRGHKYVKGKWVKVPSNVALLCVNKKIYMEAAPVLYSRTRFRFRHPGTMRRFLNSIGDNVKYLRDVGLCRWEFRAGLVQARHALEALAAAENIHTLEVSEGDLYPNVPAQWRAWLPGTDKVVRLCRPLFNSLKASYKHNGLKASILEVIKIKFDGSCGFPRTCTKAELQRMLKQSIAEQHGLKFEP
jgi:hypothetical protein